MEETGFVARSIQALGSHAPCTARLSNRIHSFFVEIGEREQAWQPEAGIEVKLVTPAELTDLILSGRFVLLLHIGTLLLVSLSGLIDLEMLKAAR